MRSVNIRLIKNTQDEGDKIMYEIMSADEAIRLIRDGDCICVNSFVGIENPTELHEAILPKVSEDAVTDASDNCIECRVWCLGRGT